MKIFLFIVEFKTFNHILWSNTTRLKTTKVHIFQIQLPQTTPHSNKTESFTPSITQKLTEKTTITILSDAEN